jgi:hypothetical protein
LTPGPSMPGDAEIIGIALAPADRGSCDEILQNADLAMYEAKSSGRRTYLASACPNIGYSHQISGPLLILASETESRSAARFEQSATSIWLSVIQSWRLTGK